MVTSAINESDDTFRKVVRLLAQDGITQQQIAEEVGISQSRVSQLKREARTKRYIDGRNRLTDEGRTFIEVEE